MYLVISENANLLYFGTKFLGESASNLSDICTHPGDNVRVVPSAGEFYRQQMSKTNEVRAIFCVPSQYCI